MTDRSYNILLVDDDPFLLELHAAFLEDKGWTAEKAEDGAKALERLTQDPQTIDIVVSDISMPQMNGYELCEKIKSNQSTQAIPVLFVSALSDLEEKLKGYSSGASDYIAKPVMEEELFEKIKTQMENRAKYMALSEQATASQSMAMEALTFSSELGQVIEFYKNLVNVDDYQEVANMLFEMSHTFNLECSIQIYAPNRIYNIGNRGIVSPLEANVIELARKKPRFYDFGGRTIINYRTFSILLKNMPLEDPKKYGRIKDIMGMICNGLEAKIQQLNNDAILQKKEDIIKSIQTALHNIEQAFAEVQNENIAHIEDMIQNLNQSMFHLNLLERQEDDILNIANNCLAKSNKAFYKGLSIHKELENIRKEFSIVLDSY